MRLNGNRRDVKAQVFIAPVLRLSEMPGGAWIGAAAVAVAEFLMAEWLFFAVLALALVASVVDYRYGVKAAKAGVAVEPYDPNLARLGFDSKAAGVWQVLLIWILETLAARAGIVYTGGMVATGLAFGLFAVEWTSINHHRQQMGGRPLPGFRRVVDWLNELAGDPPKDGGAR